MRNFGFGKNLDSLVIYKIAKHVREAQKNGTASEKKNILIFERSC